MKALSRRAVGDFNGSLAARISGLEDAALLRDQRLDEAEQAITDAAGNVDALATVQADLDADLTAFSGAYNEHSHNLLGSVTNILFNRGEQ